MLHSSAKTCALFMYFKPVRNLESPDGHVYSQVVFLNKPGFNNSQNNLLCFTFSGKNFLG